MRVITDIKMQEIKKFYFENSSPKVNYMPCFLGKLPTRKIIAICKIVRSLKNYPNLKQRGASLIKDICRDDFTTDNLEIRAFILDLLADIRVHKCFENDNF